MLEHCAVAAESATGDREGIVEADQAEVSDGIDDRKTVVAFFKSHSGVDAMVAIERIAEDAHRAGFAVELMALEQGSRHIRRGDIERPLVK